MTDRIRVLSALVTPCGVFVDVGCDHGFITKAVLDKNLCERAIITDISEKCLNKARQLLAKHIESGRVESLLTDGLKGVERADQVCIAGMGGEEIVKIISESPFLTKRFILQPMKNTKKVRKVLLGNGYKIEKDFVFYCGRKYYDVIVASLGQDFYNDEELDFGRTNLTERSPDFIRRLTEERDKLKHLLSSENLSENSEKEIIKEIKKLERYL